MEGYGSPETWHVRNTEAPSSTVWFAGDMAAVGGTEVSEEEQDGSRITSVKLASQRTFSKKVLLLISLIQKFICRFSDQIFTLDNTEREVLFFIPIDLNITLRQFPLGEVIW